FWRLSMEVPIKKIKSKNLVVRITEEEYEILKAKQVDIAKAVRALVAKLVRLVGGALFFLVGLSACGGGSSGGPAVSSKGLFSTWVNQSSNEPINLNGGTFNSSLNFAVL